MRVTLVTETFPPEINGVAMTLERLALGLVKEGDDVQVVRPRQPAEREPREEFDDLRVPGVPLYGYEGLRMGLPTLGRILRGFRRFRPDVVYVATEGPLGLAAIGACRWLGIPVVSGFHTNFQQYMRHYHLGFLTGAAATYLRLVHNATARTFGPSHDLLGQLRDWGFENLRLLGRGVDTDMFNPDRRDPELRRQWGVADDEPVAIYVGRLASEKNIDLMTRTWEAFRAANPGVGGRLVLVGDGPELEPLRRRHPDYLFCGARRGDDLGRHFASGDIFLFASQTETFGNVVTEALASGLVVVAFAYAAPRWFIRDGENGYLVEFGDEEGFLRRGVEVLASRDAWPAVRTAAAETGRKLSWRWVLRGFRRDLEQVIGETRTEREAAWVL